MESEAINPFQSCEENNYAATGEVVEELARINTAGDAVTSRVAGTFLKVLVAHSQINAGFLGEMDDRDLLAVGSANNELYPHVLLGAITEDVSDWSHLDRAERSRRSLERNRRTNFARTAASTLRSWVKSGGALENLNPATVTKSALLADIAKFSAAARDAGTTVVTSAAVASDPGAYEAERKAERCNRRLVSALRELQAIDADRARLMSDSITNYLINTFEES